MTAKSALFLPAVALVVACAALPGVAQAASEADCTAQWKSADGNGDGVLMSPEADRYLAYYRVRSQARMNWSRVILPSVGAACDRTR